MPDARPLIDGRAAIALGVILSVTALAVLGRIEGSQAVHLLGLALQVAGAFVATHGVLTATQGETPQPAVISEQPKDDSKH